MLPERAEEYVLRAGDILKKLSVFSSSSGINTGTLNLILLVCMSNARGPAHWTHLISAELMVSMWVAVSGMVNAHDVSSR